MIVMKYMQLVRCLKSAFLPILVTYSGSLNLFFLFIFSNILPTCFVYRHELLLFEALREGLDE